MHRRRIVALLGLAACACSSNATITISYLGWSTAKINGYPKTASLGHSLTPFTLSGWTSVAGAGVEWIGRANGTRLKNGTGTSFQKNVGKVSVAFKCLVSPAPPAGSFVEFDSQLSGTAVAYGRAAVPGSSGDAKSLVENMAKAEVSFAYPQDPEVTDGLFPKSTKGFFKGPWTATTGGASCQRSVDLPTINVKIDIKALVNGGNATAVSATAYGTHARGWAYPVLRSSTYGTASINVPDGRISCDVTDLANNMVEAWYLDCWSGEIALPRDYPDGTYKYVAKAPGTLRCARTVVISGGNVVALPAFAAKYGDIDGDNYVSPTEVALVYGAIGASSANDDVWYEPYGGSAFSPYQMDFDGDGAVTIADYNLASVNMGLIGD
ncbi:hypothetical protein EON81_25080 [bacterium]|nr:MAG: hypothetical protein EON81_25080 [bacterium]